jgi:hypothetical protein
MAGSMTPEEATTAICMRTMTREEWYGLRHSVRSRRRDVFDSVRRIGEILRPVMERAAASMRQLYRTCEPVVLAYERERLVLTLAAIRDQEGES